MTDNLARESVHEPGENATLKVNTFNACGICYLTDSELERIPVTENFLRNVCEVESDGPTDEVDQLVAKLEAVADVVCRLGGGGAREVAHCARHAITRLRDPFRRTQMGMA